MANAANVEFNCQHTSVDMGQKPKSRGKNLCLNKPWVHLCFPFLPSSCTVSGGWLRNDGKHSLPFMHMFCCLLHHLFKYNVCVFLFLIPFLSLPLVDSVGMSERAPHDFIRTDKALSLCSSWLEWALDWFEWTQSACLQMLLDGAKLAYLTLQATVNLNRNIMRSFGERGEKTQEYHLL